MEFGSELSSEWSGQKTQTVKTRKSTDDFSVFSEEMSYDIIIFLKSKQTNTNISKTELK